MEPKSMRGLPLPKATTILLWLALWGCGFAAAFHPAAVASFRPVLRQRQQPFISWSSTLLQASSTTTTTTSSTQRETEENTRSSVVAESNRGDARGAALLLEDVSVYRGPACILRDIDWRVEPRQKWALVGANGAGKSTLLKAITGEAPHSDGRIVIGTKEQVGYLQQTAVSGSTRTVFDEACAGMTEINEAAAQMDEAQASGDLDALVRATERFEAADGYQRDQKVAAVLKGLGFADFEVRCDELSGGWQMRVAFARQLLSEPTLSLLDEPGNHLDAAAKAWLAKYLANYNGAGSMILVTHDVELLKSMDHIAEVIPGTKDGGSLQIYKSCNYDQFLQLKQERAAAAVSEYERNQEKAAKLQAFVDRFGASATKASAAQSRVKQLEKMKREGLLDAPTESIVAQRFRPTMKLPNPPRAVGPTLLSLKDASLGYEQDGSPLVSNVNLEIVKGMKLLIRGPNGSGKSTLLKAIHGTLPLLSGERRENPDLRLGVFTQDLAQELDPNARAVDLVTAYARGGSDGDISVSDQAARSAMGRLGLQGEKPLRRIRDLSGGEKARVALAMFALKPSNVYFLDEPSNHLDTECVEALSESLSEWGDEIGAMVVVSHDRAFCEQIGFTHVATVKDGTYRLEERSARASDWVIDGLSSAASAEAAPANGARPTTSKDIDPKLRKQAFNAPKRIVKLEKLIEEAEEKLAILDEKMLANGSDVGKLVDWTKEKEALESKMDRHMQEWGELEEILAQVAS